MSKKGHQKYWRMKIDKIICSEKVNLGNVSPESEMFFGNRWENLKQEGNTSLPQVGWTSLQIWTVRRPSCERN